MSRTIVLLAATTLLAGCAAIGGPKTEVSIYAPQTRVQADPAWPAVDWQLTVGTPDTHALLDSQRIAVRPSPDRLQTYKGARWADTAPELLQTALVRAFEDSGRFTSVARFGNTGRRGDVALFSELRHFETIYTDGQPRVVVELQARLVGRDGRIATKRFREEVAPATPEVDAVATAFGQAMASLSGELVAWSLAEGGRRKD